MDPRIHFTYVLENRNICAGTVRLQMDITVCKNDAFGAALKASAIGIQKNEFTAGQQ